MNLLITGSKGQLGREIRGLDCTFKNISCSVFPIEPKEYPTAPQRPHFTLLNKSKIKTDFGIIIPYRRDSLVKCIRKINSRQKLITL